MALVKQMYTGKTATENSVILCRSTEEHSCIMLVSIEAMGYSSICSEQEYTGYTASEILVFYVSCEAAVQRVQSN